MLKLVQLKTPLGIQTYLWKDNGLVRPEDLSSAEVIDIKERLEQLKTSRTEPFEKTVPLHLLLR